MSAVTPTSIQLQLPKARVHVRVQGEGAPVLLLHGGGPGTSSCDWLPCMALLPPNLQAYAPDYPGFGLSGPFEDGSVYGAKAFVETLRQMFDALCLPAITLVGHSMGAALAATLTLQIPERIRQLILVGPGGPFYGLHDHAPGMAAMAQTVDEPTEERVRTMVRVMCDQDAGQEEQVRRRLQTLANPLVLNVQRTMQNNRSAATPAEQAARAAIGQRVRELRQPVTLVWGEAERFNPPDLGPRILAKLPPHTVYHPVAHAGHNVQCDQPHKVAELIARAALG